MMHGSYGGYPQSRPTYALNARLRGDILLLTKKALADVGVGEIGAETPAGAQAKVDLSHQTLVNAIAIAKQQSIAYTDNLFYTYAQNRIEAIIDESGAAQSALAAAASAATAALSASEAETSVQAAAASAVSANTAKADAEAARNTAQTYRDDVQSAVSLAQQYRNSAQAAQSNAESARDAAVTAKNAAEAASTDMTDQVNAAAASAQAAEDAASSADSAATDASNAQAAAEAAMSDAAAAQSSAESAQSAAEAAASSASFDSNAAADSAQAAQEAADSIDSSNFVTSVNTKKGDITLSASDVGAVKMPGMGGGAGRVLLYDGTEGAVWGLPRDPLISSDKTTGTGAGAGTNYLLFGPGAYVTGGNSQAMGEGAAAAAFSLASGRNSKALGSNSTAYGYSASASGSYGLALGYGGSASHSNSISFGGSSGTATTEDYQLMVGPRNVEITSATRGLVLRSPDNTRWRQTIANNGLSKWTSADGSTQGAPLTPSLVIDEGDPIPPGTPVGTIIFERTTP